MTYKIPDIPVAMYRDGSTTDINAAATNNLMPWSIDDITDAQFVHSTSVNTSRIQVHNTGIYEVSGGITCTSATASIRYNGTVKVRADGVTLFPMRAPSGFIHGQSGATDTCLNWAGWILSLTASQYIEFLIDRENTVVGAVTLLAGQSWISIKRLR